MTKKLFLSYYVMQAVLIIDTSGEEGWVALVQNAAVIVERTFPVSPDTGKYVLQAVEDIIDAYDISRIAVHVGPSVYSSALRAGAVVASLLAEAWGSELVGVEERGRDDMLKEMGTRNPVSVLQLKYNWKGW